LPENAGIIPTQNAASEATYHHINLPTKFGRNAIYAPRPKSRRMQTIQSWLIYASCPVL